jgi:hypothetical protein
MTDYQVRFYKRLQNSSGHPFSVLQRTIVVSRSETVEDAVRIAQQQFERLEEVRDWHLHADFVETDAEERAAGASRAA